MMFERLLIRQARRTAIAGVKEQRAEICERADMRAVALDDLDVGIARRIAAPEHIEHARTREQQPDIIGRLLEPFLDISEVLRIAKRRKHKRLYAAPYRRGLPLLRMWRNSN